MNQPTIFARDAELRRLDEAISQGRSFLLYGPTGVGKTLLLKYLTDAVPQLLYCGEASNSQLVFRTLAAELFARNSVVLRGACGCEGLNALEDKSAVALRGIVAEALRKEKCWIALDHLRSPSQSFAANLKEVCSWTETPIIAAARSEHMEDVGFLLPMFSERSAKLSIKNFDSDNAMEFAVQIAQEIKLDAKNRKEALDKIVSYSKGNPGAIIAMLRMAADSRYVDQQHIKLAPLYIDFRMSSGVFHG